MRTGHIEDLFEAKAREGDGQFAIAFALLQMAHAISEGFNCETQRTDHPLMGDGGISDALSGIAEAIEGRGKNGSREMK